MILRELSPIDAKAAAVILHGSWQSTFAKYLPSEIVDRFSLGQCLDIWQKLLEAPSESLIHLGAFDYDRLLGTLSLGPSRFREASWQEVWAMHVEPSSQNRGIGTRLLNEAFEISRSNEQRLIHLLCIKANEAAIRFYQRNGGSLGEIYEKRGFEEIELRWNFQH